MPISNKLFFVSTVVSLFCIQYFILLCMTSAERRKVNVLEMKCLRSLVGVSRMDRVRNEEVRRRAGIERE